MDEANRAIHLVVSGRVQGVGFRAFIVDAAARNGLFGWVRNVANGDVEIWAEGDPDRLERLAFEAGRGPSHALVTSVRRDDGPATGSHRRFEVRPRGDR